MLRGAGMEADGFNETIVTSDLDQIVDDELWDIMVVIQLCDTKSLPT